MIVDDEISLLCKNVGYKIFNATFDWLLWGCRNDKAEFPMVCFHCYTARVQGHYNSKANDGYSFVHFRKTVNSHMLLSHEFSQHHTKSISVRGVVFLFCIILILTSFNVTGK